MIRNAKVGERVKLNDLARWAPSETQFRGRVTQRWPADCTTGMITRRELFYKQSPTLWVTPDHPAGVGETRFRPSELERLPKEVPA